MDEIGLIDNTMATPSGIYFDFADPQPDQIDINEIARSLSNTVRYRGFLRHGIFYSVAEHCVHCAELAFKNRYTPGTVFYALMHDAAEAYTGDCPKPLKVMLPDFQNVERRIENAINKKFDINTAHKSIIKDLDYQMLKAEKKVLFPNDNRKWSGFDQIKDVDIEIQCWKPEIAEVYFLNMFNLLQSKISIGR